MLGDCDYCGREKEAIQAWMHYYADRLVENGVDPSKYICPHCVLRVLKDATTRHTTRDRDKGQ